MTEWSLDRITDEIYRHKLIDVPSIIADWLEPYGGLAGKEILDFGCGEATMAMGLALRHGAKRVVAVDTHAEIDNCSKYAHAQLGLDALPANLTVLKIEEESSLRGLGEFDVIYSWSVFEHVRQDLIENCFRKMKDALRPGGIMFLQTTPLYYSAWGAHLRPFVPQPWSHLLLQQDRLYQSLRSATESREQADHLQWVYETLNKTSATFLIAAAQAAGFDIIREYRTFDEDPIPHFLLETFKEEALRTAQLVFLARAKEMSKGMHRENVLDNI